jgi:hypothetical protein
MVPGWVPFKIVSDSPRTALTDTILKGDHPETILARFGLTCFSGFRGEYLNVIFYQNMHNLHKMMSFLTYITGFFMNFELLPILTDYAS